MKIKIIDKQGKEVFAIDAKQDKEGQLQAEFVSHFQKEAMKIELILEEGKTIEDYANAIDNGDGTGIIKEQIITLST